MAGDFVDVSNLGNVDKLIDESLTVHFGQNPALVVVPATDIRSVKSYAASMRMDKKIIKNQIHYQEISHYYYSLYRGPKVISASYVYCVCCIGKVSTIQTCISTVLV
jgi:hypothetical protein